MLNAAHKLLLLQITPDQTVRSVRLQAWIKQVREVLASTSLEVSIVAIRRTVLSPLVRLLYFARLHLLSCLRLKTYPERDNQQLDAGAGRVGVVALVCTQN